MLYPSYAAMALRQAAVTQPHKGRVMWGAQSWARNRADVAPAKAALREAEAGALSDYVIEWGWQAREVTQAWHQDCEAGGWHLQDSVAALLRHSAAVHMAEDRRSMEEIQQFLSHSDINVTRKIYARFSPDYLKEAAEALEIDDLGTLYRRTLPKADHQPLKH